MIHSHPLRPLRASLLGVWALAWTASLAAAAEGSWIEIESVPVNDEWVRSTAFDGHTGEAYYSYTEGRNRSPRLADALVYYIDFPVDGTYRIEYRGRRDKGAYECPEDAAGDRCNDMFTQLDDGSWYKTMMKRPQYGDDDGGSGSWSNWMWDGRLIKSDQNSKRAITAGVHRLAICGRSPGISLDAIRIYLDGDEPPTSDAPSWLVADPGATPRVLRVAGFEGYFWEIDTPAEHSDSGELGQDHRFDLTGNQTDATLSPMPGSGG